jgi:hypothetical protein
MKKTPQNQTWVCHYIPHTRSAKTKGLLQAGPATQEQERRGWITAPIVSGDRDVAYKSLCALICGDDTRPLQGKSYLRPFTPKLGQRVYIVPGWTIGFDASGNPLKTHTGVVSEVLCGRTVSVSPDGYANKFVDFSAKEVRL